MQAFCRDPMRKLRGRGLTLVELVVVMAVATLLVAIVPLAHGKASEALAYRATLRHLLAELRFTRDSAMQRGEAVAFVFDAGRRQFGMVGRPARSLPEGITARLTVAGNEREADRGAIRFAPDGGASGGSILLLRADGSGVRIEVDWLLGRVRQVPLADPAPLSMARAGSAA